MTIRSRTGHLLLALLALALPAQELFAANTGPIDFKEVLATADTVKKIRNGGHVLYLRHGPTDNSKPDFYPINDFSDCSRQRPLTESGRKLMAEVGSHIRKAGIPVSEIRSSPLCRARESARAAFPGNDVSVDEKLMYVAQMTAKEKAPVIANTRHLLSMPVTGKWNRVLVAHAPNLVELIDYFPKEGTLVIFVPRGNDAFDYVASIPPDHWKNLSR